jgi:CheY-like chemotaxis protein
MAYILVTDDDPVAREVHKALFRKGYGGEVHTCNNGVAALEFLRSHTGDCLGIVSDMQMPRMNGMKLLMAVKNDEQLRHIPFFVVSGLGNDPALKVRLRELGAMDCYVKPLRQSVVREIHTKMIGTERLTLVSA